MRALVLLYFLLLTGLAQADEPTITVTVGKDSPGAACRFLGCCKLPSSAARASCQSGSARLIAQGARSIGSRSRTRSRQR
jgi:hypothetical protein